MGAGLIPSVRLEGWEGRLAGVVEAARHVPYQLGEHDCFRFACAVVEALTGIDRWPEWAGRYTTRREALRCIHAYGGAGFTEAGSKLFGGAPVPASKARRGDVLEFVDPFDEKHLGVCVGAEVAVLADGGLRFVRLSQCAHAWRVG